MPYVRVAYRIQQDGGVRPRVRLVDNAARSDSGLAAKPEDRRRYPTRLGPCDDAGLGAGADAPLQRCLCADAGRTPSGRARPANAVKYGALGQSDARLAVKWHVEIGDEGEPWLHVSWQESAVAMPPAGATPLGTGQGRTLIEKALPYQLHARTTYVMAPDGVRCTITLPASARTKVEMPSAA